MKPAQILFFISGPAPTPEQFATAAQIPAKVMFRNALAVPNEPHALEVCDGVYGDVPPLYAEKFPSAEEAIAKKQAEMRALCEVVGDRAAPGSTAEKLEQQQAATQTAQTPAAPAQAPAPAPAAKTQASAPAPAWNPGKK